MTRVFTGPNSFALKEALKKLKTEFVQSHGELSLEVIDAEEAGFEQIVSAVESVPFLASQKLVVVYDLGANKEAVEKIDRLIEADSANELLIVEQKMDKRSAYYKYLKKNTELTEFKELNEYELANWLASEAKNKDGKLSIADANYLVQRIGVNQEQAANELSKLLNFKNEITRENIDLLTEANPQTNIFNLLDSAFNGNAKKALAIYEEQRIQGEEPLKIFAMITWQLHQVALADAAAGRSDTEIMQASGLKPFNLNKSKSIARRMGREKIREVLHRLTKLDRQLKTSSVDADDVLKNFLGTIS